MFVLYERGSFLKRFHLASHQAQIYECPCEERGYNKAERLVLLDLNSQQADAFRRKNVTGFLELKRSSKRHSLLVDRGMWTKHSVRRVPHPFNVVSRSRVEALEKEIEGPEVLIIL